MSTAAPALARSGRRFSVSSESTSQMRASQAAIMRLRGMGQPGYSEKPPETRARLERVLATNAATKSRPADELARMVDLLTERNTVAGEVIVREGDEGSEFFIIERGVFEVVKGGTVLAVLTSGRSFGELALMYGVPRVATVRSVVDGGLLWVMERVAFRATIMLGSMERRERYLGFLRRVALLTSLSEYEKMVAADSLTRVTFRMGDVIIRQGDPGDAFFIIEAGEVEVKRRGRRIAAGDPEGLGSTVSVLKVGEYFGEVSLIARTTRNASVVACTDEVVLLSLTSRDFASLLGPCLDVLRRNMRARAQPRPSPPAHEP